MKIIEDLDVYAFRKGWPKWACMFIPIFYPATWPIIVYRFGSWVIRIKNPIFRIPLYLVYFPFKRLVEVLTTIDISERAVIDEGLFIAHIGNIVIGYPAEIGHHASIHQGVTIGGEGSGGDYPKIGNMVYLSAGAKIVGPVKIGNGVVVGANAVVVKDAPDNAVLGGVPAKIISSRGSREFIHYRGKDPAPPRP